MSVTNVGNRSGPLILRLASHHLKMCEEVGCNLPFATGGGGAANALDM